ncbi:uncharacterized protein LOC110840021 [Zootermopsis nevadensis]|uniref:hydroxyisourate hydrolase n=1 Tax=Zootermopsis nevadensis TaxID=136037 RepID=A0A067QGY3_ZOONE|nr:uncharacterized protein LOC110840021 [Zootermopsis nevadensis]KDR07690.1 5-hydroxyisourate hydrolase [Zootermopsis nevadensis]
MDSSAIKVRQEFSVQTDNLHKSDRSVSKVNPKYYKQSYRIEWESMPDFKGWLKGVPGEPNRAYCLFCKKSLHAHRLSLLKHTCTLKHTKAAQKNFELQGETEYNIKVNMEGIGTSEEILTQPRVTEVEIVEDIVIADAKVAGNDTARENDSEFSQTAEESGEAPITPKKRMQTRADMAALQGPLSTHVLDTARGNPVGGLQVSLYKLIDGRWTPISEGLTNPDGRFTNFIKKADFTAGRYKLHFDVDRYFELRKLESLYPFIEIVFDVKSPQDHYHVPLLLSPFGYTTYRGS